MRNLPRNIRKVESVRKYKLSLTENTKKEWLEHCKRAANDFKYFCEFMCGIRIHDGQLQVVNLISEKDYGVLAAGNGWGKTLLIALLVLWASFGKKWAPPGWGQYTALVLGPVMEKALIAHSHIELLRKNKHEAQMWCEHPDCHAVCPDRVAHKFRLSPWLIPFKLPNTHLAFRWKHNDSLMHFESAENKAEGVEGWRVNVVFYDEARLELYLDYVVNQVLLARGTRSPNMKVVLSSTPLASSQDLLRFFNMGFLGNPDWWAKKGNIIENIFIDKKQVEKIRRNLDPRVRDQVLAGEWVEPPDAYFIREKVDECFDTGVLPDLITDYRNKFLDQHSYVAGVDTAVSEYGAESVVTLWDITTVPFTVILEKAFPKGTPTTKVVEYCDILVREFGCTVGFDGQGPLGIEFEHQVSFAPGAYIPVKFAGGKTGEGGTSKQKADAMANFRHMINNNLWWCPNLPELKKQIIQWQIKDHKIIKDRLMAQVYAAWVAKDYLNLSLEGISIPEKEALYQGHSSPAYGPPKSKLTELQRKHLEAVENQKYLDEMRGLND